jgi:hypothetical protein
LVDPESKPGVKQTSPVPVEGEGGVSKIEADSKPIAEVGSSKPIVEAESRHIAEADSRPVLHRAPGM